MKTFVLFGALMVQTCFCSPIFGPGWLDLDELQNEPGFIRVKRNPDGSVKQATVENGEEDKTKVTWVINTGNKDKADGPLMDLPSEKKELEVKVTPIQGQGDDVAVTTPVTSTSRDTTQTQESEVTTSPQETKEDNGDKKALTEVETPTEVEVNEGDAKEDAKDSLTKGAVIFIEAEDVKAAQDDAENAQEDAKVDTFFNKCLRVRCTPPPVGTECVEKSAAEVKPLLTGLTSECCPVHSCKRNDGSTFIHYAIEIDEDSNSTQANQRTDQSQNTPGSLPAPPPRPQSLPPFISSYLPPIFPFLPSPSSFYNAGSSSSASSSLRQFPSFSYSSSSSSSRNNLPPSLSNLLFPPLSSGSLQPTPSSTSFKIILPQISRSPTAKRHPSHNQFVPQTHKRFPSEQLHSRDIVRPHVISASVAPQQPSQSQMSYNRYTRNLPNGMPIAPVTRLDTFVGSAPYSVGQEGILRSRRNTADIQNDAVAAASTNPFVGRALPFAPMTINGFPFIPF